jgi:hypothetical protein
MLKISGGLLIAFGLGWLLLASQMDVSVSSCDTSAIGIEENLETLQCLVEEAAGTRSRIVNLGLLSEKNNSILLAGLTALAGVVLFALSFNPRRAERATSNGLNGRGSTSSAVAWLQTQKSIDARDYTDFAEAFRGTPEALLALKCRRVFEDWDSVNKNDGAAVESFYNSETFPAMKRKVRQFIADEAASCTSIGALNQRLLEQEAAEALRMEQLVAERIIRARTEKQ